MIAEKRIIMKIYLLRHGETNWSKDGRLQGHINIPMNEKGIRQVNAAGELLSQTGEIIDLIITSPLIRARKSAEIIADKIGYNKEDIVIEYGFIERNFGLEEGLTSEERKMKFPDGRNPDIESVRDLCERAGNTIAKYINEYPDKTILLAAHSSIIKAVLSFVTKGEFPYKEGTAALGTGEFCILEYKEEAFRVMIGGNQ